MRLPSTISALVLCPLISLSGSVKEPSLEQVKTSAAARSKYLSSTLHQPSNEAPKADLEGFRTQIEPILENACIQCHGPDKKKGGFRIDELDPDLLHGEDADWWLEVIEVLSNGEMPPPEDDVELTGQDRGEVIDWLSGQVLIGSQVQRSQNAHSSFRRMTRYEFSYTLQDLLHVDQDFAADLPPETTSDDGFQNNSEMLQMTSQQFVTYREIARKALKSATFQGAQPRSPYFSIPMDKGGTDYLNWVENHYEFYKQERALAENDSDILGRFKKAREQAQGGRLSQGRAYFLNKETGEGWNRTVPNGFSLWEPHHGKPTDPKPQNHVLVIPHGARERIDLGNHLPDRGVMKIRFRASRSSMEGESYPSVALSFGANPNNNSRHEFLVSKEDIAITASPEAPEFYQWLIPLDGLQRNPYLRTGTMGQRPTPTEYISIRNVHQGPAHEGASIHIDYIEVTAPYILEWPPQSHRQLFPEQVMSQGNDEETKTREILASFMPKAWRRPVSQNEVTQKLKLFQTLRPTFDNFEDAIIETLAAVLSSPHFLYLSQSGETITDDELASRLSFFLWSSQPDKELLQVASRGQIKNSGKLAEQAKRMLANPKSERFIQHFTHHNENHSSILNMCSTKTVQ